MGIWLPQSWGSRRKRLWWVGGSLSCSVCQHFKFPCFQSFTSPYLPLCLLFFSAWYYHRIKLLVSCPCFLEKAPVLFLYVLFTLTQNTSLWHFCHQMCVGFSLAKQFSDTSWGTYSVTEFWRCLPEDSTTPHRSRAQPQDCPLLQMPVASPGCSLCLWPINWVPVTPSLGSVNFLKSLTELRETLTFTSSLKDVVEDTDEQPDGETRGEVSGALECCIFGVGWRMWSPTWKASEPPSDC